MKKIKKQDTEVSTPKVNHDKYPKRINITDNKGIVIYHNGYVVMANTCINECKAKVMKDYTTDNIHEYNQLEIIYETGKMHMH